MTIPFNRPSGMAEAFRANITLCLAACGPFLLAGCNNEEIMDSTPVSFVAYPNVEECARDSGHTLEECQKADQQAREAYQNEAGRYYTLEECQKVSDNCAEKWDQMQEVPPSSALPPEISGKTEGEVNKAEQPAPKKDEQTSSAPVIYHHYYPWFYPTYSGFMMPSDPATPAQALYNSKTNGLSTVSGVSGVRYGERATVPSAFFKTSSANIAGRTPTTGRPATITPGTTIRPAPVSRPSVSAPSLKIGSGGGARFSGGVRFGGGFSG